MSKLYLGWATEEITPPKPVYLFGQMYRRISTHVRDPLTATALAIETTFDDSTASQALIISCDLLAVATWFQGHLKSRLKTRMPDFDPDKLFICVTHTHNGPFLAYDQIEHIIGEAVWESASTLKEDPIDSVMTPEEYCDFLLKTLEELAVKAWKSRQAGGISAAFEYAVIGHNRRMTYDDGSCVIYGKTTDIQFDAIEGSTDHGVELLYVWDEFQTLTGVVINVACPSQVMENESFITADYWSEVKKQLQQKFDKPIFVLPLLGASGEISPHGDLIRRGIEPNMHSEEGMAELGRRIVKIVENQFVEAQKRIMSDAVFKHHTEILNLPLRQVTDDDIEHAYTQYVKSKLKFGNEHHEEVKRCYETIRAYEQRQRYLRNNTHYPMELHVIRLGPIAIASNPFELFVDYGLRIKAQSRAHQTFVVQLACDYGGYLPTRKAINGRGYSANIDNGLVGSIGGNLFVSQTVNVINTLFNG